MKLKRILKAWLPLAVVTSAFCALVYVSVQHSLRSGLNDPQIQLAEDAAYALNHGAGVEAVTSGAQIDMSLSLAPFIVVYDTQGNPVAGSGTLGGQLPQYPKGALDSAGQSGENRVTWQPNAGVRIASVVVPYNNGFVMAGRNMREVEKRESMITGFAAGTWLLCLALTLIVIAASEIFLADKK